MTAKTPELRLEWRHTWPEKGEDYCAKDPQNQGPHTNCRVYLSAGPGLPMWRWVATGHRGSLGQGWEATAKEAPLAAEAAYWAAIKNR